MWRSGFFSAATIAAYEVILSVGVTLNFPGGVGLAAARGGVFVVVFVAAAYVLGA